MYKESGRAIVGLLCLVSMILILPQVSFGDICSVDMSGDNTLSWEITPAQTCTIDPQGSCTDYTYSTSNPYAASVDENGLLTGLPSCDPAGTDWTCTTCETMCMDPLFTWRPAGEGHVECRSGEGNPDLDTYLIMLNIRDLNGNPLNVVELPRFSGQFRSFDQAAF
jgi:hypothetical protein